VAQRAGFIWMFPLTFLSNAFVPTQNMPTVLRTIADWNPISAMVLSLRDVWGSTGQTRPPGIPGEYPIPLAIGWIVLILVIFVPLSIAKYRHAASR
jgi:ABC-2 type transport system permease protein